MRRLLFVNIATDGHKIEYRIDLQNAEAFLALANHHRRAMYACIHDERLNNGVAKCFVRSVDLPMRARPYYRLL
jgi:hypothetical protein